ncbi:EpsG family protein [Weissella cibaria]|uniref:EpsG family protein n=1 Tax=Weissella cibaria TaxID=137591 RepID=UPI00155737BA|nr:EpsG family protein [Weissella cibaria]
MTQTPTILIFVILFAVILKWTIFCDTFVNSKYVSLIIICLTVIQGIIKITINTIVNRPGADAETYYTDFYLPMINRTLKDIVLVNTGNEDMGFRALMWIMGKFPPFSFLDFQIIIYCLFVVTLLLTLRVICDWSSMDIAFITIMLYGQYSNAIMSAFRQGIAISFIVAAVLVISHGNSMIRYIVSISFSLLAVTFHSSALGMVVVLLVCIILGKRIKISVALAVLMIMIFLSRNNLTQKLFGAIGEKMNKHYEAYVSQETLNSVGDGNSVAYLLISMVLLFGLLLLFKHVKFVEQSYLNLYIKIYILGLIFFYAFAYIAYSYRIGMYPWILGIFIMLYAISRSNWNEARKGQGYLLLLSFVVANCYLMNSGSYFITRI